MKTPKNQTNPHTLKKIYIMEVSKMTVLFWSSTQKKSYQFANQNQFDDFNWQNFKTGDIVWGENGEAIGKVKAITKTTVYLTDL